MLKFSQISPESAQSDSGLKKQKILEGSVYLGLPRFTSERLGSLHFGAGAEMREVAAGLMSHLGAELLEGADGVRAGAKGQA